MNLMYDKLITFIKTELEERGWSHRELARRARVSQTSISGKRLSIEKRREVLAYTRWQLEREQQAATESSDTGEDQATAATSA